MNFFQWHLVVDAVIVTGVVGFLNLYKDNEITEQGLESGLNSLPDYLAEKVRADLQTDC